MTKLSLQNIHKSFNQQEILHGASFSAEKGNVVALMGSSGSGKSTLLRCINLLTIPDQGLLQIDEQVIQFGAENKTILKPQEIALLRRKIGMVFQQFNLWAHMTVMQNLLEAPLHVLKQNKTDAVKAARKLLTKMGLENKMEHYPAQLSGGQQQRVAIARALMMNPEIMLFDEPTSALDPEMVGEVLMAMQQLAADGMTMIVATHELNFARKVADQSIFLDNGKIIEQGPTAQLFSNPTTERFKKFLQAMQH